MYSTWPYFTLRLTYGRNLPPRIWHRARLCSVPPVPDRKDADDRSTVDETGRARGLPYGRFLARGLHYPLARAIDSRSVEYINCNFFHVRMFSHATKKYLLCVINKYKCKKYAQATGAHTLINANLTVLSKVPQLSHRLTTHSSRAFVFVPTSRERGEAPGQLPPVTQLTQFSGWPRLGLGIYLQELGPLA